MNNQNAIHIDTPVAGITAEPSATESTHTQAVDQATLLASTPEEIWQQHCMNAVKSFLKNVVIVDNEPYTPPENAQRETDQASLVIPDDDGMGGVQAIVELSPLAAPQMLDEALAVGADLTAHRLDIIEISDSFADAGLSCAFVLPKNADDNREIKIERVLKAAKTADVLIIDWQLEIGSSTLTQSILEALAKQDKNEGGRLRLICIYTGMPSAESILSEAKAALELGGIILNENLGSFFRNDSCLLAVVKKQEINGIELPRKTIDLFVRLSTGLVSSFALASVGAIRKNTHHLLTRFGRSLDSAYVANRLITNPPEDTAELMRELLSYEFDNSIGIESIADKYLSREPIEKWINQISHSLDAGGCISKEKIIRLLKYGIGNKGIRKEDGTEEKFSEDKRYHVSSALAGSLEKSRAAEREFATLVSLKREGFGPRQSVFKTEWRPSLTTGTILQREEGDIRTYYICLTPACDTLRLESESAFLFIEANESSDYGDIMIHNRSGALVLLSINQKRPVIHTMFFAPDQILRRVKSTDPDESGAVLFQPSQGGWPKLTWLGEMRYGKTTSEIAKITGTLMRIGLNDSEYLRLMASKIIKF